MASYFDLKEMSWFYANYRPRYPKEVAEDIIKYANNNNLMDKLDSIVDVASGSGQSTFMLADFAHKVIGLDISKYQIQQAIADVRKPANVQMIIGSAYNLPLADHSVDLVTCFMAVHWFDLDEFVTECKRVLKPGGSLVMNAYWYPKIQLMDCPLMDKETRNKNITDLARAFIEDFFDGMFKDGFNRYEDIYQQIPINNKVKIDGELSIEMNLLEWYGFCCSLKNEKHLMNNFKRRNSPLLITAADEIQEHIIKVKEETGLMKEKEENIKMKVEFDFFQILMKVP